MSSLQRTFEPRKWQPAALEHLLANPRAGLFMRPGMGKTPVSLLALKKLMAAQLVKRVLVIAPKRVADYVWPKEIEKWDFSHDLTYRRLVGGAKWKAELTQPTDAVVDIANFEQIASKDVRRKGKTFHYPGLVELWSNEKHWPYDLVIVDESTRVKGHNAAVFRTLRKVVPVTEFFWILTGSFIARDVQDAWAQVYLLDRGERLERNITRFRERWCWEDNFHQYHGIPGAVEEITDLVSDICLSMRLEDYEDIDKAQEIDVPVYLNASQAREYRRFECDMVLDLGANQAVAANAAVLSSKCRQYANGAMFHTNELGGPSKTWSEIHSLKLDAVEELVEEIAEPVLISYAFQPDLERLKACFPKAITVYQDDFLVKFQNGESDILLLHPKSAAHGLDGLQDRCRSVIIYSAEWSYELYDQLIERVGPTRQLQSGHKRPVFVYRIVADGTVDNLITERWRTRESVHDILMRRLRAAA